MGRQGGPFTKVGQASKMIAALRAALFSGILGGNLATLPLLRRPSAALAYVQYGLFGWRMIYNQGLPQRQFHEMFEISDELSVNILPKTSYFTQWDANYAKDAFYLAMLGIVLTPKVVFEIGTYRGYSALLFALNTGPDTHVYTLDLPPEGLYAPSLSTTLVDDKHIVWHSSSDGYLYSSHSAGSKVRQLYGDSARFDFSPYRDSVDMFFIDGAHSYEYVRSDTLNALECVRPGGVIVWHDYGRWGVNGVSKWLHEFARRGYDVCRLPGSSLAILKKYA